MGRIYIESREHSIEVEADSSITVSNGVLHVDDVAVGGLVGRVHIFWEVDLSNSRKPTRSVTAVARGHVGNVIGAGSVGHRGNVTAIATGGNAAVAVGFSGDINVTAVGDDTAVAVGFDGDINVTAVGDDAAVAVGFDGDINVTANGGKITRIGHGGISVGDVAENAVIGHGEINVAVLRSDSTKELPASDIKGLLAD